MTGTELIAWHDATANKPDSDSTVLLWIEDEPVYGKLRREWDSGWWDGEAWRLCESGGVVDGRVLAFAEPRGPQAEPESIIIRTVQLGAVKLREARSA